MILSGFVARCCIRQVSSFRAKKPSPEFLKLLEAVHQQIRAEEKENMDARAERHGATLREVGVNYQPN